VRNRTSRLVAVAKRLKSTAGRRALVVWNPGDIPPAAFAICSTRLVVPDTDINCPLLEDDRDQVDQHPPSLWELTMIPCRESEIEAARTIAAELTSGLDDPALIEGPARGFARSPAAQPARRALQPPPAARISWRT
jgi:hypothetical protein